MELNREEIWAPKQWFGYNVKILGRRMGMTTGMKFNGNRMCRRDISQTLTWGSKRKSVIVFSNLPDEDSHMQAEVELGFATGKRPCKMSDWTAEGWAAGVQALRDGGWIVDSHQPVKRLFSHMQKAIVLMADFKSGGVEEGYKDLRPESAKLIVSEDVQEELKKAEYWEFLEMFEGYDIEIWHQMARSWVEGCVIVGAFSFEISPTVISKNSSLVDEGLKITKDTHPQQTELDFFTSKEKIGWDDEYILREGLPHPWPKVVGTIMNYFTLDSQMVWVHGYHLAILNNMRWRKRVNVSYFLFKELEKSAEDFQRGRTKYTLHQGLILLIVKFMAHKQGWMGDPDNLQQVLRRSEMETLGRKGNERRIHEAASGAPSGIQKALLR